MFAAFVVAFILCGAASAATVKTNHVNTAKIKIGTSTDYSSYYQTCPDISGTRVVWVQDNPYANLYPDLYPGTNSSVWLKNIATGYKGKVMASSERQFNPKISGIRVVWEQLDSSGHHSIYFKNVITGKTGKVLVSTKNQYEPDISGGLIVWKQLDEGVSNIHYKNIFTGVDGSVAPSANMQIKPAVSGTRVVWMQRMLLPGSTFKWVLYVKDIKKGNMKLVQSSQTSQWNPAISGPRIVWIQRGSKDLRGIWDYDLYYKNIVSGSSFRVQSAPSTFLYSPSIDGSLMAWTLYSSLHPSVIYYRNIATNKHGTITSEYDHEQPSVSGSRIVWTQYSYVGKEELYPNSFIYIKNLKTRYIGRL